MTPLRRPVRGSLGLHTAAWSMSLAASACTVPEAHWRVPFLSLKGASFARPRPQQMPQRNEVCSLGSPAVSLVVSVWSACPDASLAVARTHLFLPPDVDIAGSTQQHGRAGPALTAGCATARSRCRHRRAAAYPAPGSSCNQCAKSQRPLSSFHDGTSTALSQLLIAGCATARSHCHPHCAATC